MPEFIITDPKGQKHRVTVPEGATENDAIDYVIEQSQAFDAKVAAQQEADRKLYDPTKGMSAADKFFAGAGKAVADTGRGIGQLFGFVSDEEVNEAAKRDAALMNDGWGVGGNVAGHMATFLTPGAALKGAGAVKGMGALGKAGSALTMPQTYTGAALGGGLYAGLQPVLDDQSRLGNASIGALGGGLGMLAGRTIKGGYDGAKSLLQPMTAKGRERIAGNVLNQNVSNVDDTIARLQSYENFVPGVNPTTGEVGGPGLAGLEKVVRASSGPIKEQLLDVDKANNLARTKVIDNIFKGDRELLTAARREAVDPLIDALENSTAKADASGVVSYIDEIMGKSTGKMKSARGVFGNLKKELIEEVTDEGETVLVSKPGHLYGIRREVDALINAKDTLGNPINNSIKHELKNVRAKLDQSIQKSEGIYKEYLETYTKMSKPINKFDAGKEFKKKVYNSELTDQGDSRLMPNAYAKAVSNSEDVVKRATGRKTNSGFKGLLSEAENEALDGVRKDLARQSQSYRDAATRGSDTFQNMITGNALRETTGALGGIFPKIGANNLVQRVMTPIDKLYSGFGVNQSIQEVIERAMLDPKLAAKLMQEANDPVIQGLLGNTKALGYAGRLSGGAVPVGLLELRD